MKRLRTLPFLLPLTAIGLFLPASLFGYDYEVNPADLPPPAAGLIDFSTDIKPIFEQSCLECHGAHRARPRGRYLLDSREHAMSSGNEGNNIIPGNSARSPLIHYVAGLVPDLEMPPIDDGEPLTTRQVSLLRAWIDDGAVWPREIVLEAPEEKKEDTSSPAQPLAASQGLPPAVDREIDFIRDIKPIFEGSCIECHGDGRTRGDFSLDTRENLLRESDYGPVVLPGNSRESYLIELVAAIDPSNFMPKEGPLLSAEEVGVLRAWIDQGAPWEEGFTFRAYREPVRLAPRRPDIPEATAHAASNNPIDLLLEPYFAKNGITPPPVVGDASFARRVYLDTIGLLPSPDELHLFLQDRREDKRERLVERLLSDNQAYAEHWLTFWNDALRNDYRGTGYIDGGRRQITAWLYGALAQNMPYDQFVRELVNPSPASEGFTRGIVWRGTINASEIPPMQAAQNISQVFMGVNLKCASCHDSFIDDWKLSDAYGLANIYSDQPMEIFRCDQPTGQSAGMKFLYEELGTIDADADRPRRLEQLAQILTSEENGRMNRTIVNRLWARFLGRGLVEPIDDMDAPPWNADILDWLAVDLGDNGYDLRKTMQRILTSRAYQLPSIDAGEYEEEFVFQGPLVRRLSAEQFRDALTSMTGAGYQSPAANIDFAAILSSEISTGPDSPVEPKWIWNKQGAAQSAASETVYLRKEISLPEAPTEAFVSVTCDNAFTLYVNGHNVGSSENWEDPKLFDILPYLKKGINIIAASARNGFSESDDPSPAGFLLFARVRSSTGIEANGAGGIMDFASNANWLFSEHEVQGWEAAGIDTQEWHPAVELGGVTISPWNTREDFAWNLDQRAAAQAPQAGRVRASLSNADPLLTALGRPPREQVVTRRYSTATTLEALELTNGHTLAAVLQRGAGNLLASTPESPGRLAERIFIHATGREPTDGERELSIDFIGHPLSREGIEDFLWAVIHLPEFQLIY